MTTICKLKKGRKTFEAVVNNGMATPFKAGTKQLRDVLAIDEVFTNFKKGDRASRKDLDAAFGAGTDKMEILAMIIRDSASGSTTAEERRDDLTQARQQIVYYIQKHFVQPGNAKRAIPAPRIEAALDALKVRIDPTTDVTRQAMRIAKKFPDVGVALAPSGAFVEATADVPTATRGECATALGASVDRQAARPLRQGLSRLELTFAMENMDRVVAALEQ